MKKKILLIAAVLALAGCEAEPVMAATSVLDQFSVALLGHTETILETTTRGTTNAELLVTPIQVGKLNGGYVAGFDFGVLGNVAPTSIGQAGYNWTVGVHVHLSPLFGKFMSKLAPNYPALAALEVNPRVSYLWRNHTNNVKSGVEVGLGLGWAWSATPQQ